MSAAAAAAAPAAPDELDEVVELDDEEEEEIRAENARPYPADLPAGPEAATVDEMRKVLEVVELGVRNVEVDFSRPGNVGHARAFRKLQTKLNVLRFQAMSFKWSPGFVNVLRQARYMRVLPDSSATISELTNYDNYCFQVKQKMRKRKIQEQIL